ncbi:MAG: DNA repair protein RecO [Elusimicrobia bacterium]|nr:DNA repair protein RecO [Elusimicrobiota bacterium]
MIEIVSGVVLRSEDWNETDKRLVLYTREFGKIRAKVVGVRKESSRLKGLTIPFIESRFQIYLHGSRRTGVQEPGKVVGGEILSDHAILRENWDRIVQSSVIVETLDRLTHSQYPNPQEYQLLSSVLDQMELTSNPVLLRCRFSLMLLKILGYSLLHHPTWKSYRLEERELLRSLARWDGLRDTFSQEESQKVERMTESYLMHYLPGPLKTQIFCQKVNAAGAEE